MWECNDIWEGAFVGVMYSKVLTNDMCNTDDCKQANCVNNSKCYIHLVTKVSEGNVCCTALTPWFVICLELWGKL